MKFEAGFLVCRSPVSDIGDVFIFVYEYNSDGVPWNGKMLCAALIAPLPHYEISY